MKDTAKVVASIEAWVPVELKTHDPSLMPTVASFQSYCAAWLYGSLENGFRTASDQTQVGMGGFLVSLSGECAAFAWAIQATIDAGGSVGSPMEMLAGLSPSDASSFATKNCKVMHLQYGSFLRVLILSFVYFKIG